MRLNDARRMLMRVVMFKPLPFLQLTFSVAFVAIVDNVDEAHVDFHGQHSAAGQFAEAILRRERVGQRDVLAREFQS